MEKTINIALVGNPNVGKSVIFNALTGAYVTVSNYPGTTIEISKGTGRFSGRQFSVVDTPGVNSLEVHSEDEQITKEIIMRGDINCVIQVADAKNLKRSLLLTLELGELGIPMVLCLNMSDEARERGLTIDTRKLSDWLGIDVVETVAVTEEGLLHLKEAVLKARPAKTGIVSEAAPFPEAKAEAVALLKRRARAAETISREVLGMGFPLKKRIPETIGRLCVSPLTGIPLLLLVLFLIYLFVGKFAAGIGVDFIRDNLFGRQINPAITGLLERYLPVPLARDILVGQYGIITMALTYAFAIIFPIVTAFFLLFGILEDSGYLPRLAVLSDRLFSVIGLNGRAILPMILGLGCGTMATLTARILDTKKERILVTFLLALAVPCSAQLGVVMGLLGSISFKALLVWLGIMAAVLGGIGWLASRVIPGERTPFIQEIPPMRMPQPGNIWLKTLVRIKWYLKEAVPLFILGTLILFVADKFGLLAGIKRILSPLVVKALGLPGEATDAFIIGFLRRDYGAAGLYALAKSGGLDKIQLLVSLVVVTLFVPCIAQFFVTVKERGVRVACLISLFVFFFAFCIGFVLNVWLRFLLSRGISVI